MMVNRLFAFGSGYALSVNTLGFDMATRPEKTGACSLLWQKNRIVIDELSLGWDDEEIVQFALQADKVGFDAPLGWPVAFLQAITSHQADEPSWPLQPHGDEQRRELAMRITDLFVQEKFRKRPLSSSADLIALVAFRQARIEESLRAKGASWQRDGGGLLCEVYPSVALQEWGIPAKGYKKKDADWERAQIVSRIKLDLPTLEIKKKQERALIGSDDLLDALISALVARAVALSLTYSPNEDSEEYAKKEGWIHVPKSPLAQLI